MSDPTMSGSSAASSISVPMIALDPELDPPRRMRAGDAAADLPSRVDATIEPGERALIPTGFAIAVPLHHAGLVLPRSGLALHSGLTVLNTPGLIDSGYRGEINVIVHNTSDDAVEIERGQRIAQLMVIPAPPVDFDVVDELPPAPDDRGADGFGSSG